MKYLLLGATVLMLGGCSVDDAIDRADRAAEAAVATRAEVEAGIAKAEQLSAQLKAMAAALDSEKAAKLIAQGDALVASAKAALPIADEYIAKTKEAADVARAAKANGDSWFTLLVGVVGVFVPAVGAAGTAILKLRSEVNLRNKAIVATAAHADRMEEADGDLALTTAKLLSAKEQEALGVKALIEKLRGP